MQTTRSRNRVKINKILIQIINLKAKFEQLIFFSLIKIYM